MVSICLECNSDTDTLENPKAGHKPDCPTKRNCAKCGEDYFPSYHIPWAKVQVVEHHPTNTNIHNHNFVDLCLSCELSIWNMVK